MLRAPWTPLDARMRADVFERARARARRPRLVVYAGLAAAAAAAMVLAASLGDSGDAVERAVPAAEVEIVRGSAEIAVGDTWRTTRTTARVELPARLRAAAGSSLRIRTSRGAELHVDEGSDVDVDLGGARVARGGVRHSVEPGHGAYRVRLGGVEVVVTGTVFWTGVDGADIAVCVVEGGVRVMRGGTELASLAAGESWRSSEGGPRFAPELPCAGAPDAPSTDERRRATEAPEAVPLEPAPLEPAPLEPAPRTARATRRAPSSVAPETEDTGCARARDPAACYRRIADGAGLAAEGALYQLGRIHRREGHTDRALDVWREHERRFPSGTLLVEVRLAELETLLAAGSPAALASADAFLDAHAQSAHGPEVRTVRGTLRHRRGDLDGALADYEAALARALPERRRDEALFGRAACLDGLGRSGEAEAAYRAYLRERPGGRFADRARARLDGR